MLTVILQVIDSAINDIVIKYKKMMNTIAKNIIKDEHLAEDIVQISFLRINKNLKKIDNVNSAETKNYIITITRNVAFSMIKKENKIQENVQFIDEDRFNNIEGEINIEVFKDKYGFNDDIVEVLSAINEVDKDIITLRYGAGYSCKEIAEILEMSQDSVYKRCQRTLGKLEKVISEKGGYIKWAVKEKRKK